MSNFYGNFRTDITDVTYCNTTLFYVKGGCEFCLQNITYYPRNLPLLPPQRSHFIPPLFMVLNRFLPKFWTPQKFCHYITFGCISLKIADFTPLVYGTFGSKSIESKRGDSSKNVDSIPDSMQNMQNTRIDSLYIDSKIYNNNYKIRLKTSNLLQKITPITKKITAIRGTNVFLGKVRDVIDTLKYQNNKCIRYIPCFLIASLGAVTGRVWGYLCNKGMVFTHKEKGEWRTVRI